MRSERELADMSLQPMNDTTASEQGEWREADLGVGVLRDNGRPPRAGQNVRYELPADRITLPHDCV